MEQIAGVVASGVLIAVASTMMKAAADDTNVSESAPNAGLAVESFNSSYATAASSSVLLAASFGCSTSPYTALQAALSKTATPLTMYATENYATLDLRSLLRSNISFVTERKLQTTLLEEGLVMIPGEACGLEEPGFFRINVPKLSADDVTTIVQKLSSVSKKFNTASKRTHDRTETDTSSSPSATAAPARETKSAKKGAVPREDDEVSVAESVPERQRAGEHSQETQELSEPKRRTIHCSRGCCDPVSSRLTC
jgi:hypothetical protein